MYISQAELLQRVQRMPEEGVIRRMGAGFDSNISGFRSTLSAGSVVPETVDRTDEIIGQFPEVTHSYLRNNSFNIRFTIIATDERRIEDIFERICISLSLDESEILNLPMKRLFKLDARFRIFRRTWWLCSNFTTREISIDRSILNRPPLTCNQKNISSRRRFS